MRRSEARTLSGRRTGSGPLRRTKSGRRNLRGRRGEQTLSSMVRTAGVVPSLVLSAFRVHSFFSDDSHAARRKYKKEVDKLKPDLEAYNKQKETAMGLAPGTLSQNGSSTFSLTTFDPTEASGSQVNHLAFRCLRQTLKSAIPDGPDCSPTADGSRKSLPGCE